jgi:acyl carrier protein
MELEQQIKKTIINSLELEDITIDDINVNESLFGDGLGLDSIDSLELGMALKKEFSLNLSKDKEQNKKIFYSVKTIADYIRSQQNG